MNLHHLIEQLSAPSAYPYSVASVEVVQTHISVVFLAGSIVYKIKKPVQPGFLDFSTLEKRRHFCEEEVRLNRRLAPDVYLGVVPVVATTDGLCFEGNGTTVEWAVKMVRLPQEATLQSLLQRDRVSRELLLALATKLVGFHKTAARSDRIAAFGRLDVVASNARENLSQAESQIGLTISQDVFDRLHNLTEAALSRLGSLIDNRAEQSTPCDTHGDLRLDHVYVFFDHQAPNDIVIVDCIEFNERFRYADPVSDLAFLVMDLAFHGRRDLGQRLANDYFRASSDTAGQSLLPFYAAYRSAVRAKVNGLTAARPEVSEQQRTRSLTRARAHWLLALVELATPRDRPALILIAGLPGTGKSTLAQSLAEHFRCQLIRSDVVRKELAGETRENPSGEFEAGIYTPEWTDRTYAECLVRAEEMLYRGQRVVVDANFRLESQRDQFRHAATRSGVPAACLICEASATAIEARLKARQGNVSDADWTIHQHAARQWQQPAHLFNGNLSSISTDSGPQAAFEHALQTLRLVGLE